MVTANKKYSEKQEKYIAELLDAKKVPASGATSFHKGDVILADELLVECKTSTLPRSSFTLDYKVLEKLKEQAFGMGVPPNHYAVTLDFGRGDHHFLINEKFFIELLTIYKEHKEANK